MCLVTWQTVVVGCQVLGYVKGCQKLTCREIFLVFLRYRVHKATVPCSQHCSDFKYKTLTSCYTPHCFKESLTCTEVQCIIHRRCANCIQISLERVLKTAAGHFLTWWINLISSRLRLSSHHVLRVIYFMNFSTISCVLHSWRSSFFFNLICFIKVKVKVHPCAGT